MAQVRRLQPGRDHADDTRRGDRQGPIAAIDLPLRYLLVNRFDLGEGARHIHPLLTLHNKVPSVNCRGSGLWDMLRRLLERLFSSHRAPNTVRTSSSRTLALRRAVSRPVRVALEVRCEMWTPTR